MSTFCKLPDAYLASVAPAKPARQMHFNNTLMKFFEGSIWFVKSHAPIL